MFGDAPRELDTEWTAASLSPGVSLQSEDPDILLGATPRVLVVIPAFNEAVNLPYVIEEVRRRCPEWDIVVIDDGSTDETAAVARRMGVTVLRLPANLGIGAAVQTGLIFAHRQAYDICLQVDGDGQHDPGESVKLVDALLTSDADVVGGSRFLGRSEYRSTFARRIGIRVLCLVLSALARESITDPTSGQRAFGRRAIALLAKDYPQQYPEPEVVYVLRRHGLRMLEVSVQMRQRHSGHSSISPLRSLLYMAEVILAVLIHASRPVARGRDI